MKAGYTTSEAGVAGATGIVALIPIVMDKVPQQHVWIAIVAFAAVAIAYVTWRSVLKIKGLNGK